MDEFIKHVIEEKFASKKQAKYFYAKANDKTLSPKERSKWKKWSNEFASKTNFDKIPNEVKEEKYREECEKLYYAVYNNHTIGLLFIDRRNHERFLILHASGLRKSPYNLLTAPLYIDKDEKENVRKATEKDFEDFNVSLPSDFNKYNGNDATEEKEVDEIVDADGNISRGDKPTNLATKGVTSKKTTDAVRVASTGQLGTFGILGGSTGYSGVKYWTETDMSKALGYKDTLGKDEDMEDAEDHFEDDLGLPEDEAKERLEKMGYDPELPDGQVRLVENPKKYIEEYIESLLAKKSKENDVLEKDNDVEKEINPIIKKQLDYIKQALKNNNLSTNDILKYLSDDE